jgi:hypothetical protein
MTAYQQVEVCLPINERTVRHVYHFLTLVQYLLGPGFFHSRDKDPWSIQSYYLPKGGGAQQVEQMMLLRIAVDEKERPDYIRNLQLLHKRITAKLPAGLGEEASSIVFHPVTRVT